MTVFYLPIEPLIERYTSQMFTWVTRELKESGEPYAIISPTLTKTPQIKHGQFLDIFGTIEWKSQQLQMVAQMFQQGQVKDGDYFLVGDLWFPGIESVKYMAELANINVQLWGWHYAGRADEHDFVQRLGSWADSSELGYLLATDGIFVGSQFHRNMILRYWAGHIPQLRQRIVTTGLPWDYIDVSSRVPELKSLDKRTRRVIFPHRCAPEKNPEAFYKVARHFADRGWEFAITSSSNRTASQLGFKESEFWTVYTGLSKQEYYEMLADSRIFFSAVYQETFGYALQEAIAFGVMPLCPDRCSYPEVLEHDERFLYRGSPVNALQGALLLQCSPPNLYSTKYHRSAKTAIDLMLGKSGCAEA